MRRISALFLTLLGLGAAALLWQLPAQAQGTGSPIRTGTYFSQITTSDGLDLEVITAYHRDGTAIGWDTDDLGLGGATARLDSPAGGTWERTGPDSLRTKTVNFSYDLAGNHTYTIVVTTDTQLLPQPDPSGATGQLTYQADLWLAGQNPVTDPPLVPMVGSGSGLSWLVQ